MRRVILCLGLLAMLAACGSGRPVAPETVVEHARYAGPGPTTLTLVTSIRSATGVGAHSALIINASQRVIFDPAGSYQATIDGQPVAPQRGDVIYGVSPPILAGYLKFQSAKGFHATTITVPVSPEVAETALQRAEGNGAVSQAFCADATSSLLASLPGFESLRPSMFPRQFMREVAKLPGVTIKTYDDGVEVPNNSVSVPDGERHVGAYTDF